MRRNREATPGECGERLIRALERGGCAAPLDTCWGVWRSRDLRGRCIGRLSEAVIARLQDEGQLSRRAGEGRRLFWSGEVAERAPTDQPPARPLPIDDRRPARKAARLALEAALGRITPPEHRTIALAAARRFEADVERAAAGQRITQNWDPGLHVDSAAGPGRDHGGRGAAAQRASRRLVRLGDELDAETRIGLTDLIVYRRSLASLARRRNVSRERMAEMAGGWLVALAAAYGLLQP